MNKLFTIIELERKRKKYSRVVKLLDRPCKSWSRS
jgi:hypothetical protein